MIRGVRASGCPDVPLLSQFSLSGFIVEACWEGKQSVGTVNGSSNLVTMPHAGLQIVCETFVWELDDAVLGVSSLKEA